jgi:DNA-binding transcriptional MerR regulator
MLNNHSNARSFGSMHVAELALRADVTPATIRYYARIGLLNPGREPENDYRCFSTRDLRSVIFIRQAQALGLTIGDIKAILKRIEDGEIPCQQVRSLVEQRLESTRGHIADLQATETRITHAMELWEQMPDQAPFDGELNLLIDRVDEEPPHAVTVPGRRTGTGTQGRACDHQSGFAAARGLPA